MGENKMNHTVMGLKSRDDDETVALQSVHAQGQLQGLMLRMKLRQVYRNTTGNNLECVYTFPLAWGSVLLSMAVELNGKRMTGTVVEKKEAETTYEKAIQSGDLPVMLERSGKDLYTANLGNILPGDNVVIEIDYAQLLRLEGGMLRLALPTAIAPRYGDEHRQGGLAPHQTTVASPLAEYRLHVSLDIANPLAQATISSPSHGVQRVQHQNGVMVKLQDKAWLDRDFVLTLHGLKDMVFAMASADATQPGQYTLLSSATAHWDAARTPPAPLRMKVLVDGSGSMQGDSNAQARDALDWLFHQLETDDEVSMTRFGTHPQHVLPRLQKCTEAYQRRLRSEARNLQADLGGTEMDRALEAVIRITTEDERPVEAASILLITDGEVWNIEHIVATVRQSGHRLFALGVGSAPAESLLRELAEVSGGACEMVSPNQSMQQAVARLLERLRHACAIDCRLESDEELLYQSPSPREISQGDTLHQWAQSSHKPLAAPRQRWTLSGQTLIHQAEQLLWDTDGVLPRLCAAQRLHDTTDTQRQRALAVQYQLVTPHTNFILVHTRAEGEKAQDLPLLQQVAQMQAAGVGGHGTVMLHDSMPVRRPPASLMMLRTGSAPVSTGSITPSVWRSSRTHAAAKANGMANAGMDDIEIPAFLRKAAGGEDTPALPSPAHAPKPISKAYSPPPDTTVSAPVSTPVLTSPPAPTQQALPPDYWQQQRQRTYSNTFTQLSVVLQSLDAPNNPLVDLLQQFNTHAYGKRNFRAALSVSLGTARTAFMADFVLHHAKALGNPALVWAVLLLWLADEKGLPLDRHARRLLEVELANVDGSAKTNLISGLEGALNSKGEEKVA
jgi:Ca-activated chloride channel family protein